LLQCISHTGDKGSHLANKKTEYGVQQRDQGITEGTSGLAHRTVRCATGQCPVHQGTSRCTLHLRENPEALHYNSPDCPVYTGQCPVPQGRAALELASFGNLLRYNSPDCPVSQRSNDYFAPTVTCRRIYYAPEARRSQARARRCTGQSTVPVRCTPDSQADPEVRSSNGRIPTAW
jgi:hypothetical protein